MTPARELRRRREAVISDCSLRGRASCRALAGVTDEWLAERFGEVTAGLGRRAALVAVGGYGRGELAPGSDLDLWLVHDGRSDADLTDLAEALWYPVWDAGLRLGHAVCTLRQGLALAASELDTATATLSARLVAGDADLAAELVEAATAQWRKRSSRWLAELGRRVVERHARAGEVASLLEPDIKEARGGLRDVHALGWAQAARPVLLDGDAAALAAAEDTLVGVRVELHRLSGRGSDDLLLERQDDVAAALGDADADALMARVTSAARTVAWTADEVWYRLSSSLAGPLGRLSRRDRPLGPGLVLRDNEVHVAADVDPAADPVVVLRAAAAAAQIGARIDRPSLERLADRVPVLDESWPAEGRAALVALLATGHDAIPVLEALDQRELLHRLLPEWAPTRSKPQRNAYHRFTVDRHLCETAANAAALASVVARHDLLLVGALLHDLGKGYPGDHTEVGVELVATIAPRMGFDGADTATLMAMVRHHLLLADVATRRDLADDDVIHRVAEAVGDLATLDLLAALTEADSLATGPSAWGSWKAGLVAELVERVAHVLRGGEAGDLRGDGFPGAEVRRLMAGSATVVQGEGDLLTVVAPDRPGTFSRVAGALALKSLAVRSADAASGDGRAASQFRVEAGPGGFQWDDVTATVRRALDGRLALDARLAERSRTGRRAASRAGPAATPRIHIDNHASGSSTVVEVRAPDRIGLLYRVTAAFAELDLDIRMAKVATLGSEVLDTFYVRTADGTKVVERDHVGELERAVLHSLTR